VSFRKGLLYLDEPFLFEKKINIFINFVLLACLLFACVSDKKKPKKQTKKNTHARTHIHLHLVEAQ
jgi:hypothetical protein